MVIAIIIFIVSGCNQNESTNDKELQQALHKIEELEIKINNAHTPGWGETMRGSVQVHHSNLWFAAQAENWELAEHMLEEVEESFEKLESWYPDDEETALIPMMTQAMNELAEVIKEENKEKFNTSYLNLTNTCNQCHQNTGHEIYVIQIPSKPGLTNQSFAPQAEP